MVRRLIFSAAYLEAPIRIWDVDIFRHHDVDKLPISDALKSRIRNWDHTFQETFNSSYPPDSGFASIEREEEHRKIGMELSLDLQQELGSEYEVVYNSNGDPERSYGIDEVPIPRV